MRRRDDDGTAGVHDVLNHPLAVGRRRARRADVRQDVDAVFERVANILLGVHVRVHSDPVFVRRIGNGLVVCRRQLDVRFDHRR